MRGLSCNCSQSGIEVGGTNTRLSGMGAAPSWYDNIYNEISSGAENLWNDVEGAGVWAENEVQSFWEGMQASPANPIAAGGDLTESAGLTDIPGQIGQGVSNIGSDISSAIGTGFNGLLMLGVVGIIAFALLEKK